MVVLAQDESLTRSYQSKKYALAIIFAMSVSAFVNASPILVCDDQPHVPGGTAYVLDVENNKAYIPSGTGKREGFLTTKPDYYNIKFEGNDSSFPLEITINRYTGGFELEFGSQPFGNYELGNVYRTGTCQLLKEQKL